MPTRDSLAVFADQGTHPSLARPMGLRAAPRSHNFWNRRRARHRTVYWPTRHPPHRPPLDQPRFPLNATSVPPVSLPLDVGSVDLPVPREGGTSTPRRCPLDQSTSILAMDTTASAPCHAAAAGVSQQCSSSSAVDRRRGSHAIRSANLNRQQPSSRCRRSPRPPLQRTIAAGPPRPPQRHDRRYRHGRRERVGQICSARADAEGHRRHVYGGHGGRQPRRLARHAAIHNGSGPRHVAEGALEVRLFGPRVQVGIVGRR